MLNLIELGLILVQLGATGWMLYMFRAQRKYIGSLHADASRPRITPELINAWKKEISKYTPDTRQYNAYKTALKNAGAWDGD